MLNMKPEHNSNGYHSMSSIAINFKCNTTIKIIYYKLSQSILNDLLRQFFDLS